jgi:dTDP-4-dehydrorhamnose 3,5-epimerase
VRNTLTASPNQTESSTDLLSQTLAAARKQPQTVNTGPERVGVDPGGVSRLHVPTHVDERGWLTEMFDPRWEWLTDPFAYAYATTIRPGYAKGWGLHKKHNDRYFLLLGEAEVVLYDVRPDSAKRGGVTTARLSESDHGLLAIPALVWHATRNVGSRDVVIVNFPTMPFDHADPDKYTLPLANDLIPFTFGETPGF